MNNLYGIALLPEEDIMEDIIDFQNSEMDHFKKPWLNKTFPLPHMSIFQTHYDIEMFSQELLGDLRQLWLNSSTHSSSLLQDLYLQPPGWFFLGVEKSSWIKSFHEGVMSATEHLINIDAINHELPLEGHTEAESRAYHRYGYRYSGDCFKPHITLGYDDDVKTIDDDLVDICQVRFHSRVITFDQLVVYRAGDHGALEDIIYRC